MVVPDSGHQLHHREREVRSSQCYMAADDQGILVEAWIVVIRIQKVFNAEDDTEKYGEHESTQDQTTG